jgi:hypothetical protein
MNGDGRDGRSSQDGSWRAPMGVGSWTLIVVLLSLLTATGIFVYFGWMLGGDFVLPAWGYVALGLGVVLSLTVGIGLMALLFYSSRKGYDEPPIVIFPEADQDAPK